jgi:hypothetical protein
MAKPSCPNTQTFGGKFRLLPARKVKPKCKQKLAKHPSESGVNEERWMHQDSPQGGKLEEV